MKLNKLQLSNGAQIAKQLGTLKDNYWGEKSAPSDVTSSYWQIWRENSVFDLNLKNDSLTVEFGGTLFGDFENKKSSLGKLFDLPKTIFNSRLKSTLDSGMLKALDETCSSMGRDVSFDCIKQALSINKILQNDVALDRKTICIIGDGYGFLGIFLKKLFPNSKIVSINLGRILIFDLLLTHSSLPNAKCNLVMDDLSYDPEYDFNFIPAEVIFDMNITNIDLFVNIASMQEMDLTVVHKYFDFMRMQKSKETFFYCCNRTTKTLPDKSIINFDDYKWNNEDIVYFDEVCPWYQKVPMSRPPFIKSFDGEIRHRFASLKNA